MKGFWRTYWKYILILIFGGFLFFSVIIAIGIYYPWAAVAIIAVIFIAWWLAMKKAPMMPDEYDRPELKDESETTTNNTEQK